MLEDIINANISDGDGYVDQVPLSDKVLLTVEEAADLFGLGTHKIRELTSDDSCRFVLWNGRKRLIKRKVFESFLDNAYSI